MIIKIRAKPNSERQEIVANDKEYVVYLKSAPENNKANIELIKLLTRYFKKEIKIKTGKTSRNKLIEIID